MIYQTLISTSELAGHLDDPGWVIVDCRFSLAQPSLGKQHYQTGHIPGAVYVDLNEKLSAPVILGKTGRHPLPSPETTSRLFSRLGIGDEIQVVVYDDLGGAIPAARFWWMLRWLGHTAVAVLDGGWQAWQRENRPVRAGLEDNPFREFHPRESPEMVVDAKTVNSVRHKPGWLVVDSRSADRYRGENETVDPVAGHIPGAISIPFAENLQPDGTFFPEEVLRERFRRLLGKVPVGQAVFYCGSGVSAAHNLLALEHAGLGQALLYVGSWSEWITDPERPVIAGQ